MKYRFKFKVDYFLSEKGKRTATIFAESKTFELDFIPDKSIPIYLYPDRWPFDDSLLEPYEKANSYIYFDVEENTFILRTEYYTEYYVEDILDDLNLNKDDWTITYHDRRKNNE